MERRRPSSLSVASRRGSSELREDDVNDVSSQFVLGASSAALDTISDDVGRSAEFSSSVTSFRPLTYEGVAKSNGMLYTVCDVPPLVTSVFLGVQHYLTMLGATVIVPLLVTPAMGATSLQTAQVISTMFFVSGINTLVQTTLGERLPIVQGASFSFLPATFAIIENPALKSIANDNERFLESMRVLQGAFIAVGLMQMAVGYSGVFAFLIRYIGPVTVGPVIAVIGLSLYNIGFSNVATCLPTGLTQIALMVLFSQFMKKVSVRGIQVFSLFSIILSVSVTWSIAAILTSTDTWEQGSSCRTDNTAELISQTPWLYVPYPGQWGRPRFESYAIVAMIGGAIPGMVESIGDYYSCASMSGAPPPTPGIITRGLASEGIGICTAGLFGTSGGTTSYSENIGAITLTRVGSRTVIQCGAASMILFGCISKISSLLASMPASLVGGMYCTLFGLIAAVGLSNLQYIDLNSQRNLFIVGFSIFNSLSIAGPSGYVTSLQGNPFGTSTGASVALALFSSPMIIALLITFVLDNTIPGTRRERGLDAWDMAWDGNVNNDPEYIKVYSLPLCLARVFRNCAYLESCALGRCPEPPVDGYQRGRGDIGDLCCPCPFCGQYASICDNNNNEAKESDPEEGGGGGGGVVAAREEPPPPPKGAAAAADVELSAVVPAPAGDGGGRATVAAAAVVRRHSGDETGILHQRKSSVTWKKDDELVVEEEFRRMELFDEERRRVVDR